LVFPDVNVWLALTIEHVHEAAALNWWRTEKDTIAFCRFTQIGLLRLLTTAAATDGKPFTMKKAWEAYDTLASDERTEFVPEPPVLDHSFRALSASAHISPKLWADAYLIAFASEYRALVVTFDRPLARRSHNCLLLD